MAQIFHRSTNTIAKVSIIGGVLLIGGIIAAAANPAKKNQRRQEEMDNSALDQLINDHKHNFRVRIDEIEAATLDPTSIWIAAIYSQPTHVGVLRFRDPNRGNVRLVIGSNDEMKQALEALGSSLGDKLIVNVEWSTKKNRFIRKG